MSVSPKVRLGPRMLGAIGAVSAILGILVFITGWSTWGQFRRALRSGAAPAKRVARSVDLSSPPLVASLPAHKFKLALGGSGEGFEFASSGDVSYRGAPFRPRVNFTPGMTPEILVSLPDSMGVAAAIGLDSDGQRSFFILHLTEGRSVFCKAPARNLYWSPDRRHVISLNVYEGQYFSSVDLKTDSFKSSDFLDRDDTLWYIEGQPKWSPDGQSLFAKAVVTPNPYEARTQREVDQAL